MAHLRLIYASITRQRSLYILWVLSLCAAVTGLLIVDVFRHSLTQTLQVQGRKILTADVSVSTRRLFTEEELAVVRTTVPAGAKFARLTEMFAMVSGPTESRLALLRFIDDEFPLLGDLQIEFADGVRQARGALLKLRPEVWVAGDLLALIDVKPGDRLRVGNRDFTIAGVVKKDSSQTFRFGNMAPRIYVHRANLAATGLVQFGSTLSDAYFAAVEPVPRGLKKRLEARFNDATIQATVPADLEQGSLRLLRSLLDYLGLSGLITLSLGWIGVYYLGRRWLALEAPSSAVLKCLGYSSRELRRLLTLKLSLILVAGVLLGGALAWAGAQGLLPFVRESLPAEFELVWSWKNTALLLVIGPLAGLLLLQQSVAQLSFEQPLALFQERPQVRPNFSRLAVLIVMVALLFVALTFLQARSWRVTGVFIGSLAGSVVLIAGLAYLFLLGVKRYRSTGWGTAVHLFTAQWVRRPGTSLLLITVSALAGLLSQLLPHLEKTLVGELKAPEKTERPSLFMVDIQDEQVGPLEKFLHEHGLELEQRSPFIRARILAVNGQGFERGQTGDWSTREEELEARFRNRGVNLSYREKLSKSESILEGKPFNELSRDPAEISVEEGYAKRLQLKIGDVLRFDVQGIEIDARIANLRKVDWDSFQPNFFIQFPDGVLNEAPKTWVAAVKKHPALTAPQLQNLITRSFPNVTSINLEEALDNITELIGKLSSGLQTSSRLSLALGVFVFLMVLLFQLISARRDWHQLMVLGMTMRQVWWLQVTGYGLLCLIGTVIGALLSFVVAWALFKFAFDSRAEFDFAGMARVWLITWGSAFAGLAWLGWREVRRARVQLSPE